MNNDLNIEGLFELSEEGDFEQGELIEVSSYPDFRISKESVFVWQGKLIYCVDNIYTDKLCSWKYARKIPEPKIKPYTFETFPRGIVYIRYGDETDVLAMQITKNKVWFAIGSVDYLALLNNYTISTDLCKTWRKCGEIVG